MGDESTLDPKIRRKYDRLVDNGRNLEDSQPSVALEMYKQAEEIIPNSLHTTISNLKIKMKGGTIPPVSPPIPIPDISTLPPPPSDSFSLPDFSSNDFPTDLPPPPPPSFSTSPHSFSSSPPPPPVFSSSPSSISSSPPNFAASNDELETFFDQLIDFLQVMTEQDVAEMVERRDYQVVTYLMQCASTRPPSSGHITMACKTARCLGAFVEMTPTSVGAMREHKVVTWLVRWCRFFVSRKIEDVKEDVYESEDDENIIAFLTLLSVLCGQHESLSGEEKELLDEQTFITMMIQFAIDEWNIDEWSEISFYSIVALFGISSQFEAANADPIVFALYGLPKAAILGQHLIHVTNRGVTPKWLQRTALSTTKKLFDFSQSTQRECFFFTNDIHVLLDVILREIVNLEEDETELRTAYLQLLKSVVTHYEYINKGRYKHDDVAELVISVASQGYDETSSNLAQAIYDECYSS